MSKDYLPESLRLGVSCINSNTLSAVSVMWGAPGAFWLRMVRLEEHSTRMSLSVVSKNL